MDLMRLTGLVYFFFTLVNFSSGVIRPYGIDPRLLRRTLRYSLRPAVWRVVPLRLPKKRPPEVSETTVESSFSLPDEEMGVSDQMTSASNDDYSHGRVHIKVFRGPEDEHHFAPHGYFIKHPEDNSSK